MSKKQLKKYTTRAMKLEEGPVPEAVFLPPAIRGKIVTTEYVVKGEKPITMTEHIARINMESDPVGMLIAIANGQPVATITINEEGEQEVAYETLPLIDRIPVIKFLSDKVLPRMSVFKTQTPDKKDDSWTATLSNAAEKEE